MVSDFTTEDKRAIASLVTVPGYQLLIEKVVKLEKDKALDRLKLAKERDEVMDAALDYRSWVKTVETLERAPMEMLDTLKKENDSIYGR